jgi:hypothetical protein
MNITKSEWEIIDRFKEPSSYASLGAGFAAFGVVVPAQWMQIVSYVGAGICLLLGVLLKEGKTVTTPQAAVLNSPSLQATAATEGGLHAQSSSSPSAA